MRRVWYWRGIRNARLVLPPVSALTTVGVAWLLLELVQRVGHTQALGQWTLLEPTVAQTLQASLLCIAAGLFALYRVFAFHPYRRPAYRDWLKGTCWRVGKPLPLGPVTLTCSDGILLLIATGLVWRGTSLISPLYVLLVFAAIYLLFIGCSLLSDAPRRYGYVVAFGLVGIVMFLPRPGVAVALAVPTYLVACLGLRRSLFRLPNFEPDRLETVNSPTTSAVDRTRLLPRLAGWPFGCLPPRRAWLQLARFDAVCLALLAGWIAFAVLMFPMLYGLSDNDVLEKSCYGVLGFFSLAPAIRICVYVVACRPSMSLLGRFATGRWIIPSYDRAFAAPIASLITAWWLAPRLLSFFVVPLVVAFPVTVTLTLLVALVPGPAYRDWILTSEGRIVPAKPQPTGMTTLSGRR